jgi:hypothetical protein
VPDDALGDAPDGMVAGLVEAPEADGLPVIPDADGLADPPGADGLGLALMAGDGEAAAGADTAGAEPTGEVAAGVVLHATTLRAAPHTNRTRLIDMSTSEKVEGTGFSGGSEAPARGNVASGCCHRNWTSRRR